MTIKKTVAFSVLKEDRRAKTTVLAQTYMDTGVSLEERANAGLNLWKKGYELDGGLGFSSVIPGGDISEYVDNIIKKISNAVSGESRVEAVENAIRALMSLARLNGKTWKTLLTTIEEQIPLDDRFILIALAAKAYQYTVELTRSHSSGAASPDSCIVALQAFAGLECLTSFSAQSGALDQIILKCAVVAKVGKHDLTELVARNSNEVQIIGMLPEKTESPHPDHREFIVSVHMPGDGRPTSVVHGVYSRHFQM